jgi:F-type H+-transporting ATPase subunit b
MELVKPEFGLIFWMTLTFLIVLFLMKKFAWGPILNAIQERENTIEEALNAAVKAREEMEALTASNEKLLAEARNERDKILKDAREIRESMLVEAKTKAAAEYDRILNDARKNIEAEKQAAINDLKNQVAGFSVEIAEKLLKQQLGENAQQKQLVSKLMEDIKFN